MTRTFNSFVFALAAVAGAAAVMPADAQYNRRSSYDNNGQSAAHGRGYQSGLAAGRDDARRGWGSDRSRHDIYRRANLGFTIGRLNIQVYQTGFRSGFDDGYRVGFAEIGYGARRPSSYGGNSGYYSAQPYVRPGYQMSGYRDDRFGNTRQSPAFNSGFSDGYRDGVSDGRDGDRYDVTGRRGYRRGDNAYDRRFGSRDGYKMQYRDGFRAGYDRGYRESARRGYSERPGWRR
jgi:hypothetical protein